MQLIRNFDHINMSNPNSQAKISHINNKGQGIAHNRTDDGRELRIWNALQGETISYEVIKRKRNYLEGRTIEILKNKSSYRVTPDDTESFLSTSPLQSWSFEFENKWKQDIYTNKFTDAAIIPQTMEMQYFANTEEYLYYRNKMEFSFYGHDEDNRISLAFFKRGSHKGKIPVESSALAEPIINSTAQTIVNWLNTQPVEARDLKSLVLRSNGSGKCIAALFTRKIIEFTNIPNVGKGWKGFHIYYSDPKSPAAKPTDLLHRSGDDHLTTTINGTKLTFGLHSFFQVNVPVFEQTLEDRAQWISPNDNVLDFFSGVGSISLPLHDKFKSAELIEINAEATSFAQKNINDNALQNCIVHTARSEELSSKISKKHIVLLDPPREGLHKDLTKTLCEVKPERIIYLSCNPESQIKDVQLLQDDYEVKMVKFYNFFPRTPHVESLVVLDKVLS